MGVVIVLMVIVITRAVKTITTIWASILISTSMVIIMVMAMAIDKDRIQHEAQ